MRNSKPVVRVRFSRADDFALELKTELRTVQGAPTVRVCKMWKPTPGFPGLTDFFVAGGAVVDGGEQHLELWTMLHYVGTGHREDLSLNRRQAAEAAELARRLTEDGFSVRSGMYCDE